jgi:3-dehydroquinate synthetase
MPQLKFTDLWQAMQHDKKVVKGHIHCVMPQQIGDVRVVPLVRQSIRKWFSCQQSAAPKITKASGKLPPRSQRVKQK